MTLKEVIDLKASWIARNSWVKNRYLKLVDNYYSSGIDRKPDGMMGFVEYHFTLDDITAEDWVEV